jgi:hypothetical protein
LGFDQTQNKVKNFYTSLQILQDQNAAEKGRRGLAVSVTSLLRRWCREHNLDEAIEISAETGRYVFRLYAVRRWLTDEGANIIKAHSDKVAGQGELKLVPLAPKPTRPVLRPVPRIQELPKGESGDQAS